MRVEQRRWSAAYGWDTEGPWSLAESAQLALIFGSTGALGTNFVFEELRRRLPRANMLGCSTAGEICGTRIFDDSMIVTAVEFEKTRVAGARIGLDEAGDSAAAGEFLARTLAGEGLQHVLVLSDGLAANGSELIEGMVRDLPGGVTVTGGLAADGDRFDKTLVVPDASPVEGTVAALGLYGHDLKIGYGCLGGWDPFGPERLVTRSSGNILYELDGRSALELYKTYLGEHSSGLPSTGLLFPLCLRTADNGKGVVRTILSVDESKQSMTFAGDVPEGAYARLMMANLDRLIDGATGAARKSHETIAGTDPELAILISCVGRRMVLGQRTEEEVESVREVLGDRPVLTGFYSYGELSPFAPGTRCELHNQTMTITTLSER